MDTINQKIFEDKLNEVKCNYLHKTACSLEDKISRLRESFRSNQSQIKNIESKIFAANFKEQFPIEYGRFEAQVEILRNRKNEIKEEGIRLKSEQGAIKNAIEQIKTTTTNTITTNTIEVVETPAINNEINLNCNIGSKCLRVAEFLFSSKTCNEVFYPIVGDWREDYLIALRKGRIADAIFLSVKNYFSFVYTMIVCSRFGKLIEFITKVADVIEFFNKFSK